MLRRLEKGSPPLPKTYLSPVTSPNSRRSAPRKSGTNSSQRVSSNQIRIKLSDANLARPKLMLNLSQTNTKIISPKNSPGSKSGIQLNLANLRNPSSSQKILDTLLIKRNRTTRKDPSPSHASLNVTANLSAASLRLMHSPVRKEFKSVSPEGTPKAKRSQLDLTFPMTPAIALLKYIDYLSDFEQSEILEFPQIYFLGDRSNKQVPNLSKPNMGFDDDDGDYCAVVGNHVGYRYEIKGTLGKGSFGQVLKCYDHKRKEYVALKVVKNKPKFKDQGLVEVKILKYLRDHDPDRKKPIVEVKDSFVFRKHLCISFEMLSINLYELIKRNRYEGFSQALIRRFAVQILIALAYTKAHGIVHCDLKPENILLMNPQRSGIKVIDFGSSCFMRDKIYTYIQSRFYRAPEIMLGIPYNTAIDMWSLGCILTELYTGMPLFPGESETEQMMLIMELLGVPPLDIIEQSTRRRVFFDSSFKPRITPNKKGAKRYPGTKFLQDVLRTSNVNFLDFIQRCLDWNPNTRLTPEQAIDHPWIQEGLMSVDQSHSGANSRKTSPQTRLSPKNARNMLYK